MAKSRKNERPPVIEWVAAALGAALVASSIGFMLYEAVAEDPRPPDIVVEIDRIVPAESGHLVLFRVVNKGGRTAAGVEVEGELVRGEERVETSSATIDYAPSHSEREGGLFFTQDPRAFDLRLRATGFESP